jgi:serine/threonine protein phosphatase PrpC
MIRYFPDQVEKRMRTCSVYSSPGLRPQNEDTVFAEGNVFIVADGLGGHSDGKVASELAVKTINQILCNEDPAVFVIGGQRMEEDELMEAFLMDAIRQAGAVVLQEARKRGTDMATTITAVIVKGEKAYCAHVGDCALFVSEDGSLPPVRRTVEHRRGASLNRTLGSVEQITPDVVVFYPHPQGLFLLGCDGFWEHVDELQINKIIEETPDYLLAERLGEAALKNGSPDNVSVIAVIGEGFTSSHAVRQVDCESAWLDGLVASAEKSSRMDALRVFANNHGVTFSNPLEEENKALQAEIVRLNTVIEELKQGIEMQKADHQHLEDRLNQLNNSSWKLRDVTIQLFAHLESLKKLYPREIANALTKPELDRLEAIYQMLLKQKPPQK